LESLTDGLAGVASLSQTVHGHAVGPDVVNDQLYGDVIAAPDVLVAPLTLPW
jgi:hypothetical protein